jgi:UDP-N-acetylmuramate dehydrogenase
VLEIRENVPLAGFTTLKIGGSARYFLDAASEQDVVDAMKFAANERLGLVVMGGGSNLLVSDEGFEGLVLRVAIRTTHFVDEGGSVMVRAGAGVDWDVLVAECVAKNLAGIECLSGIPGWVGGTPVQNVGAYGQEVSDVIVDVRVFDGGPSKVVSLENAACSFEYRKSIFNTAARGRYIVLGVGYRLRRNGQPLVTYPDLVRAFGSGAAPTLARVREAVLHIRRSKAMVVDPADPDSRSAGSFFKNPILTDTAFERLRELAPETPHFPTGGGVKVPAAWLIEQGGFGKGTRRERVGLSTRHALALVNLGGASAADVVAFVREIQERVAARFGVRLVPEPVFLGFGPDVIRSLGAVSVVESRTG